MVGAFSALSEPKNQKLHSSLDSWIRGPLQPFGRVRGCEGPRAQPSQRCRRAAPPRRTHGHA